MKTIKNSALVWVSFLITGYEEKLIVKLVHLGYAVGSAASNVTVTHPNYFGSLAALTVSRADDQPAIDTASLSSEIKKYLDENEVKYFAIIVSESGPAAWNGSNVECPAKTSSLVKSDMN